jgi:hypothetical protein
MDRLARAGSPALSCRAVVSVPISAVATNLGGLSVAEAQKCGKNLLEVGSCCLSGWRSVAVPHSLATGDFFDHRRELSCGCGWMERADVGHLYTPCRKGDARMKWAGWAIVWFAVLGSIFWFLFGDLIWGWLVRLFLAH